MTAATLTRPLDTATLQAAAVRLGDRVASLLATGSRDRAHPAEHERADAFERIVSSQKERVFRVALSVLGPGREAEAEDVAQEAFVRAFRALPDFRGESRVSTWIHRLAFNLAVDHRRALGRRPEAVGTDAVTELPASGAGSDPYRASRGAERERAVRAALEVLPEDQRAVFHLHYWLGHTVREIGDLLDLPPGTVKSQLHRGRERLGKELARHVG